jgi:hypothetical protein
VRAVIVGLGSRSADCRGQVIRSLWKVTDRYRSGRDDLGAYRCKPYHSPTYSYSRSTGPRTGCLTRARRAESDTGDPSSENRFKVKGIPQAGQDTYAQKVLRSRPPPTPMHKRPIVIIRRVARVFVFLFWGCCCV